MSATAERGHVLIVEDDESLAASVAALLGEEGYATRIVGNGADALAAIEGEPPCLVLLDLLLPGIDGFEVLRRIRRTTTLAVPVCVMSALVRPNAAPPAGSAFALGKPIDPDLLLGVVARYCGPGRTDPH